MASLADIILSGHVDALQRALQYDADVNQIDEYGFTPLIEAAIIDSLPMIKLLLASGANPNQPDTTGGTALHWAVENNNIAIAQALLDHQANPNAYNLAGQPILTMALLRQQSSIRKNLVQAGADMAFAQDYINVKLLGHLFELVGTTDIVSPHNQFVEVDFEGFFLEITIGLVADALAQFKNHFAARQLRRFADVSQLIVDVLLRASQLIKYQQYLVDRKQYAAHISSLIQTEPLLIPIGYEGHAITFIKYGNIWVKCDRREDSRLYDNVMFYSIGKSENLTVDFIQQLIYEKQTDKFINVELDQYLALKPLTKLKIEAQVSGNCSWANVEAAIPALFFLVLWHMQRDKQAIAHYKTMALHYFHRWRDWNKERALSFCLQSYRESDSIRKACKAEILATVLFQTYVSNQTLNRKYVETILPVLMHSPYQYILQNYVRIYYYENPSEEGKKFAALLKEYEFLK